MIILICLTLLMIPLAKVDLLIVATPAWRTGRMFAPGVIRRRSMQTFKRALFARIWAAGWDLPSTPKPVDGMLLMVVLVVIVRNVSDKNYHVGVNNGHKRTWRCFYLLVDVWAPSWRLMREISRNCTGHLQGISCSGRKLPCSASVRLDMEYLAIDGNYPAMGYFRSYDENEGVKFRVFFIIFLSVDRVFTVHLTDIVPCNVIYAYTSNIQCHASLRQCGVISVYSQIYHVTARTSKRNRWYLSN